MNLARSELQREGQKKAVMRRLRKKDVRFDEHTRRKKSQRISRLQEEEGEERSVTKQRLGNAERGGEEERLRIVRGEGSCSPDKNEKR